MRRVLITGGPIPARLDSVKFLTNRFKGGLALLAAEHLRRSGFVVTFAAWDSNLIRAASLAGLDILPVEDVHDYYSKVLAFDADAYILSAAVANLAPVSPYVGKFPSHNYKVGDKFNIEFEIAPRVIDALKPLKPQATVVGYKLFDGSEEELKKAARKTLADSRANMVFANTPQDAKTKKLVVTPESTFEVSFREHLELLEKLCGTSWYRSKVVLGDAFRSPSSTETYLSGSYERIGGFGSYAIRCEKGFFTTARIKTGADRVHVHAVAHDRKEVVASDRATKNAPLFDLLFAKYPEVNMILHGHRMLVGAQTFDYRLPGTSWECALVAEAPKIFNIAHHGYVACFDTLADVERFNRVGNV